MDITKDENMIKEHSVEITFFVPALNEDRNIERTIETILSSVKATGHSFEIIVVDDHSSDNTSTIVENFQKNNPDVPIILKKNEMTKGLGHNYVEAAYIGRGKYYMAVFGDNSEPEEQITKITEMAGKADMIIPYLGNCDNRNISRRFLSKTFVFIVNLISGYSLKYYNGPLLHLRYNVMRWHSDSIGFAYQAEIITRLLNNGNTYIEVQISASDRDSGFSKAFKFENLLSVSHSLVQILLRRIRKKLFNV